MPVAIYNLILEVSCQTMEQTPLILTDGSQQIKICSPQCLLASVMWFVGHPCKCTTLSIIISCSGNN